MRQERVLLWLLFFLAPSCFLASHPFADAFAFLLRSTRWTTFSSRDTTTSIASTTTTSTASEEEPVDATASDDIQVLFPGAVVLEFTLDKHKPLGCTVEESLAHPMEKHVFVTKIVDDGFAHAAGLQVGDVLFSVPGIFGDPTSVLGLGIEQVKSLVMGRAENEPLELKVVRGSKVMEEHENALVELCMTPGANDKQVEDCVSTIMSGTYLDEQTDNEKPNEEMDCDDEGECLVDDMFAIWAEDMPAIPEPQVEEIEEPEEKPTIHPWSSRSSGSGTYARDPATGEMKRIDS